MVRKLVKFNVDTVTVINGNTVNVSLASTIYLVILEIYPYKQLVSGKEKKQNRKHRPLM